MHALMAGSKGTWSQYPKPRHQLRALRSRCVSTNSPNFASLTSLMAVGM